MIIEDCTEGFLCFKEKIQCTYIKFIKRLNNAPLSVVAFVCTLAYPETWHKTFELGITRLGRLPQFCVKVLIYIKMGIFLPVLRFNFVIAK